MTRITPPDNGVYYFLGNIASHILHALPLYKKLGGTFIVLSVKARKEVEAYNVPVINANNMPFQWKRFGRKIKPVYHYTTLTKKHRKTIDFLNEHARVVLFYELYDFCDTKLSAPKTVFLTHGNMLKSYMSQNNRLQTLQLYDHMASISPLLKQRLIHDGVSPRKLVDIGIARTDEVIQHRGEIVLPPQLIDKLSDPSAKIVSYLPTFWGASSVYTTGLEIARNIPEEYVLLFRPHPQTPKKIIRHYKRIMRHKKNIIYAPEGRYKNLGLLDIFNASSVIIGDVSSVMLEAILTHKPLVFAYDITENRQNENDYTFIRDVVNVSQKIDLRNVTALPEIIAASLVNDIDENVWRKTISHNFYNADGSSADAIKHFIENL